MASWRHYKRFPKSEGMFWFFNTKTSKEGGKCLSQIGFLTQWGKCTHMIGFQFPEFSHIISSNSILVVYMMFCRWSVMHRLWIISKIRIFSSGKRVKKKSYLCNFRKIFCCSHFLFIAKSINSRTSVKPTHMFSSLSSFFQSLALLTVCIQCWAKILQDCIEGPHAIWFHLGSRSRTINSNFSYHGSSTSLTKQNNYVKF